MQMSYIIWTTAVYPAPQVHNISGMPFVSDLEGECGEWRNAGEILASIELLTRCDIGERLQTSLDRL